MLRFGSLVVFAILLASCNLFVPKDAKEVTEVLSELEGFDNKQVTIVGWLGSCDYYDCAVYQSLEDAEIVASGEHHLEQWDEAMDRRLNLCMEHDDKLMLDLTSSFSKVIVKGRLDATCMLGAKNGTLFCFDGCDFEAASVERLVF